MVAWGLVGEKRVKRNGEQLRECGVSLCRDHNVLTLDYSQPCEYIKTTEWYALSR